MEKLRHGDPDAVTATRKRIRRILSFGRIQIPDKDREDLEQETMTLVWQAVNRGSFDAKAGFWGFVEVVTSRRCIDWLRSRRRRGSLSEELPDARPTPLQSSLDRERSRLAFQALSRLEGPCREVIYLHNGLGKSYREMSQMLGRSEGALRVQYHRCIKAARVLRRRLAKVSQTTDAVGRTPR